MKIILADDNEIFREALIMFLEKELHHLVIAEHSNGRDLLNNQLLINADIILLDIEMPILNGIQTMKEINKLNNWMKAIAITDYYEKAYLEDLIVNGFKACVFKDSIFEKLEQALIKVHNGEIYFPNDIIVN